MILFAVSCNIEVLFLFKQRDEREKNSSILQDVAGTIRISRAYLLKIGKWTLFFCQNIDGQSFKSAL